MPTNIIPKPAHLLVNDGTFVIDSHTVIVAPEKELRLAQHFRDWLKPAMGFEFAINSKSTHNVIELKVDSSLNSLGAEGYALNVDRDGVHIAATSDAGLFYGFQTLRQLLPVDIFRRSAVHRNWPVQFVSIQDTPRFSWRGSHLDVARHFMPKEFVLKYLDLLAMHKMNVLHLHLTDDQGWRIEIKRYPKLTEIGSVNPLDHRTVLGSDGQDHADSLPQGGYYTQDDIREIVTYASDRFITVVPEIEMPGHSQAAIAAYPELGNTGKQLEVLGAYGVSENVFNVSDSTLQFLRNVLDEVLALFPSKFIHVGGDEVPKTQWHTSLEAQARMRQLGLKSEDELQSWFIKQIDEYLTHRNRRLVGWDEILEGGLAPGATVMSWRGTAGGIAAAKAGHDVVMAPSDWVYFDHYQSRFKNSEPRAIGGYAPLEKVYGYDPIPKELNAEGAKHVLGAQCQLWTEYMEHPNQVEYMAFPRVCALAEVDWSPLAARNYDDFLARLEPDLERLKILDVNYRKLSKDIQPSIGTWKSGEMSEQFTVHEWDVTSALKQSGTYGFLFSYSGGLHRLDLQWAELLENGVVISRDEHNGTTGGADKDNEYVLKVPSVKASATYTLRASVRTDGGVDSNGDIFVFRKSGI